MRELAIDFGTSNTVAALRTPSHGTAPAAARLLSVDGWPALPSAVWLGSDGTLVVGRDAERQARLDPARFEPTPKRRIDEVDVLLGDTVVPVVELRAFAGPCQQLGATLTVAGSDVTSGTWDGGGRTGTWTSAAVAFTAPNNVVFYADSGGGLCGLVEGEEGRPLDLATIHDRWDTMVRPGS